MANANRVLLSALVIGGVAVLLFFVINNEENTMPEPQPDVSSQTAASMPGDDADPMPEPQPDVSSQTAASMPGSVTDPMPESSREHGIPINKITCPDSKIPVYSPGNRPVCVSPQTVPMFGSAGWELLPNVSPGQDYLPPPMHCDKTWVMSPIGDLGCVEWRTVVELVSQKWLVLDLHPDAEKYGPEIAQYFTPHAETQSIFNHTMALSLSELPIVGQNVTVTATVESDEVASERNSRVEFLFMGALNVTSSHPDVNPGSHDEYYPGTYFSTPSITLTPGGTHQFNMTVVPTAETLALISVRLPSWGFAVNDDRIYLSIGSQKSGYQLDKDSHARDPDVNYVWTERTIPQCVYYPWDETGQTIQQYYADLGIVVLETKYPSYPFDACAACGCYGGSVLFLMPESDYDQVPSLGEWVNPSDHQ